MSKASADAPPVNLQFFGDRSDVKHRVISMPRALGTAFFRQFTEYAAELRDHVVQSIGRAWLHEALAGIPKLAARAYLA
jgi:hypothetical protein